jgi:hypothetical protein
VTNHATAPSSVHVNVIGTNDVVWSEDDLYRVKRKQGSSPPEYWIGPIGGFFGRGHVWNGTWLYSLVQVGTDGTKHRIYRDDPYWPELGGVHIGETQISEPVVGLQVGGGSIWYLDAAGLQHATE